MRTAEYERVVPEGLHRILIEPGGPAPQLGRRGETHGGYWAERVYPDEPGHEIAIPFRDLDRPNCPLGYSTEAVETPHVPHETTKPYPDLSSAAQARAEDVWVLFEDGISRRPGAAPRLVQRGRNLDLGTTSRTRGC